MSVTFALPELVRLVRQRFIDETPETDPPTQPVPVTFGWREPALQRQTSHRIVFVPGDDAAGALGTLRAPESPNVGLARPLASLDEIFTAYIEAEDVTAPDNEEAQYAACRALYDAFYRAVYLARIPHTITSQRWIADRTVRYAGAAIRITGTVGARVLDRPAAIAPSDTSATVATQKLGLTQTITVPAPEVSP
ncbi:MAG: hypothetical protein J0L92_01065 [Deltaproteobacteria bacterium]|nr:hypothetical protein [Deltaproteobacteria bacterium]